ncbi:hypothetical protein B5J93_03120 [Moraxella equi]|nr:hypothetical protein B5J93_03120 [Moraxella equi]
MKKPNMKLKSSLTKLALATLGVMSALSSQAATRNIGDLEIYQKAQGEKGAAIISMMLDTSGSMKFIDPKADNVGVMVLSGYTWTNRPVYGRLILNNSSSSSNSFPGHCVVGTRSGNNLYNQRQVDVRDYVVSNDITDAEGKVIGSVSYTITGCATTANALTLHQTGNGYEIAGGEADRFSSLKVGLISLLADGTKLDEKNKIGLGRYSEPSKSGANAGSIGVPTAELTVEHRKKLINYIKDLNANNSTPSANAYAEAGAYMLGTSTSGNVSGFYYSAAETKNGSNYNSPIKAQGENQCGPDGYGIFFLTDGVPNTSDSATATSMNTSLRGSNLSVSGRGTNDLSIAGAEAQAGSGWQYIGAYAKHLRNVNNPKKQEIRTATVGFGGDFAGFGTKTIKVPDPKSSSGFKDKIIPDCNTARSVDAKNLCLWGEYPGQHNSKQTGGWGNGGFTSTSSASALANAVTDFIGDLTADNDISALPAGSITIPDDPYSTVSQQPIAYLPMVQPDLVSRKSAWQGNLKKYSIEDGTFYGRGNVRLYAESGGNGRIKGVSLNPAAVDLWSATSGATGNSQVTSGGVYSNLKKPGANTGSQRAVFIEDMGADNKPTLRKFGVNATGELLLDNQKISNSNTFRDAATYTIDVINHLLAFVGYNGMPDTTRLSDLGTVKVTPSGAEPKLGAILHSSPSLVSYSATFDDTGAIRADGRDDYLLFGSMNGALHLVNTDDKTNSSNGGQEKLAIIPKVMLKNQPRALSMSDHQDEGKPAFGVDAPWLVVANHVYDSSKNKVTVGEQPEITVNKNGQTSKERATNRLGGMHAFGGFRMGAKGLYGIDLTKMSKSSTATDKPALDFVITPQTENFDRISYLWNKPTFARIKMNASDKYGTDVLVFGGGYDMCYEDEAFQVGENTSKNAECNTKTVADGNAVYIVNAKTGELIWSASSSYSSATDTKLKKVDTIKNSIVGSIEVLDRNNDGFMDHLYFADLGGQMFRADFVNHGDKLKDKQTAQGFRNYGVIRVLHEDGEGQYKRRFYEKPVVEFYADKSHGTYGLAMVISGDRSSPLSTMRNNNDTADRLYAIFDYDLTKPNSQLFVSSPSYAIRDGAVSKEQLIRMGDSAITKDEVENQIVDKSKQGWYYPLFYFEGFKNALYSKGMGKSEVVRGLQDGQERSYLYTSVYNPDMRYTEADSCTAQVKGGSERQFYCLPYGVCDNGSPLAGYQRAGIGIQELAFGPSGSSDAQRRVRVLISSMLASDHSNAAYGRDGNQPGLFEQTKTKEGNISQTNLEKQDQFGGSPGLGAEGRTTLTPQRWYEMSATSNE